jgi:mono/diheme cytochrome c family protein
MLKNLKTIIIGAFVAFAALVIAIQTNARPGAMSTKNAQTGSAKTAFLRNCARCHGADGLGQTELGRKLDVPDLVKEGRTLSSAKAKRIIANGKSDMPAFGKTLTKKQISSLAAYIRKL